ncbi:MAG: hypothetical protein JRJ76_16445 [Deltaproteobacteria bacterium]|nr:hypothetical protein [Deltaproteobacteria bacterium]
MLDAGSRSSLSFVLTSLSTRVRFIKIGFGLDSKTGEFAGPDLASQARHALENLKQLVVTAGYNLK